MTFCDFFLISKILDLCFFMDMRTHTFFYVGTMWRNMIVNMIQCMMFMIFLLSTCSGPCKPHKPHKASRGSGPGGSEPAVLKRGAKRLRVWGFGFREVYRVRLLGFWDFGCFAVLVHLGL